MRRIMLRKKRSGEYTGALRHHQAERGLLVHLQLAAMKSRALMSSLSLPYRISVLYYLPTYCISPDCPAY